MKRTLLSIALLGLVSISHAAPWTYRGTLNDGGVPANGRYDIRVTLLNSEKSTSLIAPITLYGVQVENGNFAVDVDFGMDLANAPAMALKTEVQQGSTGFVSLGEPTRFDPKAALAGVCWDTEGNAGTNPASNFIGTTDNQPLVFRVNNIPQLRIFPQSVSPNFVAGSPVNSAALGGNGQVIAGGGRASNDCGAAGTASCANTAQNNYATVSGGRGNVANGSENVIGGGVSNQTGNIASTVGGGSGNLAEAGFSTVSGGLQNTTSRGASTVGGGRFNTASGQNSTVVGGFDNDATGLNSTVGGGATNCAGGDFSWAGGFNANIRAGNEPFDGTCVTNSGDADGDNGTFVWADSQATTFTSSGPNQFLVRAAGGMAINTNAPAAGAALTVNGNVAVATTGSLAFGSQSRQMLNLWGTEYGIGVQSFRTYFRTAQTGGGFSWFEGGVHNDAVDNPGAGGTLRMRLNNIGQLQTTSGTISTLSDARLKDQVVDYAGALDQIDALRPVRYHYRDAGKAAFQPEGLHLGFVAQEVQQVFPEWVSEGEDGYLMLSMRGFEAVAVRAIQELNAENSELRARLAAIEARLDAR